MAISTRATASDAPHLNEFRECRRCLYNTQVYPGLSFDDDGVCSACHHYAAAVQVRVSRGPEGQQKLDERIESIKAQGLGKEFDCVIGVSGGVDSTYVAHLVKDLGLRPLAVHLDNGWNSEIAVRNIQEVLSRLGIELDTHVINWPEFRDLQRSFLFASTPDGEVPTDHAIQALLWRTASRLGVRTIVSGMNFTTESTAGPVNDWAYGHQDWRYIKGIHSRFGKTALTTYPHYSLEYLLYLNGVKRIRTLSVLNYLDYQRADAQLLLESKLGWKSYGGKHHESIYTRFYQGYVLPTKFGIDKRYWHLSDLIRAGQISRADGEAELTRPPYDQDLMRQDYEYVVKKLGFNSQEFNTIMSAEPKSYRNYRNNSRKIRLLKRGVNAMRARNAYDL